MLRTSLRTDNIVLTILPLLQFLSSNAQDFIEENTGPKTSNQH